MLSKQEMLKLIEFSTMAPSGHNSQPWRFAVGEDHVTIHPDFTQELTVVDPQHRELYVSLGCAVENFCVAAAAFGYMTQRAVIDKGNQECIIKIELKKGTVKTDQVHLIRERQTNRNQYNGKLIGKKDIDLLRGIGLEQGVNAHFFPKDATAFKRITGFILRGNARQMSDPAFKEELITWIRFNQRQIMATCNGLTHRVMGFPALPAALGKIIINSFLRAKQQNKADRQNIASSSHFVLFTTNDNTPSAWIKLGFSLERCLLQLTELGIASAYLNPPCEVAALADELATTLGLKDEFPVVLLRLGYAKKTAYSPRKNVQDVLIS